MYDKRFNWGIPFNWGIGDERGKRGNENVTMKAVLWATLYVPYILIDDHNYFEHN